MAIQATVADDFGTTQTLYIRAFTSTWDRESKTTRVDFHGYTSKTVADNAGSNEYRLNQKSYLITVTPDGTTADLTLAYDSLKALLTEQGVKDIVDMQDSTEATTATS